MDTFLLADGGFNYRVRAAVDILSLKYQRSVQLAIEVAVELAEVKILLGHGMFMAWVAAELPWSLRTVERMLKLAPLAGKIDNLSNLTVSTMHKLAAASPDIRQEILDRLQFEELGDDDIRHLLKVHTASCKADARAISGATLDPTSFHETPYPGEDDNSSPFDDPDDSRRRDKERERQLDELVSLLVIGFGDRSEYFLDILNKSDMAELVYHIEEALERRTAQTT
jgi:hypothetical protein